MAIKTYLKVVAAALLLAAALGVTAAVIVVPRLLDLDTCKARILSMAQKSLSRPVSYQTASFSWHFSPSFVFRDITIAETSGNSTFLKADRLTFKLSILPLLRREVRLKEIVVERPELMLSRNRAGVFNIDDLLRGKPSEFSIHFRSVRIINGLVRFTDRLADPEGFTTSLEKLDLDVSGLDRGKSSAFKLSTMVPGEKGQSAISVSGTARIPGQKESFSDAEFDVTLSAKNLGPGRYWPYYGRYLPFEKVHGNLDLDGKFLGKPNEFSAKGHITINDLRLNYPQVFNAPLTPREVRLAYELELTPRDLSVKSFDLTVDGLRATGNCMLGDIHSKDPRITARAATSPFRLEEFREYIPYRVIVKDTADFIEQHIKGGVYRLDEGRLDGRVSQILHMERGDNYNVLSIRGRVEKGLVTLGQQVPTFNNIKGELEMRGKDFLLRDMTGNFGGSPFTLEGKIADYPLDTPARYPFTMAIIPGKDEVAWLFRQKPSVTAFSGGSVLRLSGTGSVADYRLTGSWDLTAADYRYRQLLHKPAGTANRLRFTAHLGKTEAQLADFHYEIPSFDVTARATYRYDDRQPLTFAASTSRFQVTSLLSVMSWLEKYHPSGTVEARFGGSGNPAEPDGIRLKGDVALENFSVRPVDQIKPLENVDGTIHITETTLETEQLTGTVGDSAFTVRGRVAGLADPAADLLFSFPELHLADFGFQSPERIPEVRNLSGNISLKDKNIEIVSLSGEVARSRFTMNGEVLDIGTPKITVRADFPYFRAEDLAPLTRLRRAGKYGEHTPDITLKARVTAVAGSIRDATFEKLDTELTLKNDLLDVHSLTVGVFGGIVSGNGKADFAADGGPSYQAHYRLDQVDVPHLLRAADIQQQLTGQMTAEGKLAFRGKNPEDMKNSGHGDAEITLTDGQLYLPATADLKTPHTFPFKKVETRLSFDRKALDIISARIEAFGGVITGEGGADFGAPNETDYRLKCQVKNVDAADFLRAFDMTREVSGHLNLLGEVTAKGDSVTSLKKTAQGTVTVHLEKGAIKRYGFISKVFSILNVSQMLDFHLPDLMNTGMPYDKIDGSYYLLGGGRVSTFDLSIRTPSLNMTIAGAADIVKSEIDVKIGVQPLQTIGKVVSRIPVIGWLLTGGKKSFLVVYYEAKGKWDDPKVSTIPQTSISSGILNIFKRTLDLPDELSTKPGKVILGN